MEIGMVTDDITFVDLKWDIPRGMVSFNCSDPRAFISSQLSCLVVSLWQVSWMAIEIHLTLKTHKTVLCTTLKVQYAKGIFHLLFHILLYIGNLVGSSYVLDTAETVYFSFLIHFPISALIFAHKLWEEGQHDWSLERRMEVFLVWLWQRSDWMREHFWGISYVDGSCQELENLFLFCPESWRWRLWHCFWGRLFLEVNLPCFTNYSHNHRGKKANHLWRVSKLYLLTSESYRPHCSRNHLQKVFSATLLQPWHHSWTRQSVTHFHSCPRAQFPLGWVHLQGLDTRVSSSLLSSLFAPPWILHSWILDLTVISELWTFLWSFCDCPGNSQFVPWFGTTELWEISSLGSGTLLVAAKRNEVIYCPKQLGMDWNSGGGLLLFSMAAPNCCDYDFLVIRKLFGTSALDSGYSPLIL